MPDRGRAVPTSESACRCTASPHLLLPRPRPSLVLPMSSWEWCSPCTVFYRAPCHTPARALQRHGFLSCDLPRCRHQVVTTTLSHEGTLAMRQASCAQRLGRRAPMPPALWGNVWRFGKSFRAGASGGIAALRSPMTSSAGRPNTLVPQGRSKWLPSVAKCLSCADIHAKLVRAAAVDMHISANHLEAQSLPEIHALQVPVLRFRPQLGHELLSTLFLARPFRPLANERRTANQDA